MSEKLIIYSLISLYVFSNIFLNTSAISHSKGDIIIIGGGKGKGGPTLIKTSGKRRKGDIIIIGGGGGKGKGKKKIIKVIPKFIPIPVPMKGGHDFGGFDEHGGGHDWWR